MKCLNLDFGRRLRRNGDVLGTWVLTEMRWKGNEERPVGMLETFY